MDVRVLQYFLALAREQTISGAAEALHMTQPPLSKQLKELEEELGKQLFIRGNRRVTLTREGMLLRKRAEEIVSLVEKARAEIAASGEAVSDRWRGDQGDAAHCKGREADAGAVPGDPLPLFQWGRLRCD